jgi:CDP-diacylglycerol--glycerol-3-phosphate 3-phosphatidyltransferase
MTDVELTRALERGELPETGFHHADHLRVAWVYLQESPTVDAALGRMAATLRRFAASVGKAEKYSDAITAFWLYQLAAARAALPQADLAAVLRTYPRLLNKDLIDAAPDRAADPPRDAPHRPLSGRPA